MAIGSVFLIIFAAAVGGTPAGALAAKEPIIEIGPRQGWQRKGRTEERPSHAMPRAECSCHDACEAMWSTAASGLQRLSGMRLRLVSEMMLETYVPRIGISGTVNKQPLGGGKYLIVPEFNSIPATGSAGNLAYQAKRMLSEELVSVGERVQCPAQPPIPANQ